MPRRTAPSRLPTPAERVLAPPQETVLDLLDHLLDKGVTLTGDVALGVAGIDLIYLRLSTLLCAADRVLPKRSATLRPGGRRPSKRLRQGPRFTRRRKS